MMDKKILMNILEDYFLELRAFTKEQLEILQNKYGNLDDKSVLSTLIVAQTINLAAICIRCGMPLEDASNRIKETFEHSYKNVHAFSREEPQNYKATPDIGEK